MVDGPVRVGVLLPAPPEDFGEWLADAAAFDTAGADALWLDPLAGETDPLAVVAALSTVTFRSTLVAPLPAYANGRTVATVSRLSRGRLAFCGEREALARATRAGAGRPALFVRFGDGFARDTERWELTASPDGRSAWSEAIAEAAGRGIAGLLVPAGPRLLDILRNPGDTDARNDLHLAQG